MIKKKPLVGITGIIGSGKSTAAKLFADLGCAVFDADKAAKMITQKAEILAKIQKYFGDDVLTINGELNRSKMAEIVFKNSDKLAELNRIVHPHVRKQMWKYVEREQKNSACTMIVIDAPLIYETDLHTHLDLIVVVFASEETCITRVEKRNKLTRKEILTRMNKQIPLSAKMKEANFQINNDKDLSQLYPQVKKIYKNILHKWSTD